MIPLAHTTQFICDWYFVRNNLAFAPEGDGSQIVNNSSFTVFNIINYNKYNKFLNHPHKC